MIQFVTTSEEEYQILMPAPLPELLSRIVQWAISPLEPSTWTPPPGKAALLSTITQFVMVGEEETRIEIPPPAKASWFSVIRQFVIVGEEDSQCIPLPYGASPFRTVNPSSRDSCVSALSNFTTESLWLPSITVSSNPVSLRTTTAFPRKLMFST